MDMMEVAHAKKAQSLVSDQDYRLMLHQYTALPDDMKVQAAKRAYALQSEVRHMAAGCFYLAPTPLILIQRTAGILANFVAGVSSILTVTGVFAAEPLSL